MECHIWLRPLLPFLGIPLNNRHVLKCVATMLTYRYRLKVFHADQAREPPRVTGQLPAEVDSPEVQTSSSPTEFC